ncbi:thiol reductant ABC exporter subunit CydD [Limosilactobacillus ingluviei]|uniref:thiol reductant ABC exporter subunit CydD n=1 Tax=Limosilactobacillus ingluviei TaxID=148604 RepID=UPI0023F56332|nr:thiol reductant ABC exporter subunit CydD [Limosilactobacillus ingluviei]
MVDRLLFTINGVRSMLGKLVGLHVLQAFLIIGQTLTLSAVLVGLWQGESLARQMPWVALFILSFLGRHGENWLISGILDRFARANAQRLRSQLLAQTFTFGPALVQREGTGNMVTLTLDGISQVEDYFKLVLNKMVNMMVVPVLILGVAFYLDWLSGLIMVLVYPLIILFMIVLGYAAQAQADRQFATFQRLSNHFIDSLRGIDTLKYFGLSKAYSKSVYRSSEDFRKSTMATLRIAMTSTFALDFFTTLSIAILAVTLGLRLINGQITLYPALVILVLAPEYFLPIRNFANDYHATLNGKNAFHKVMTLINEPPAPQAPLALTPWRPTDELQVKDLSFSYGEGKAGLAPLSFRFRGYQKVGIIGMSGSGKTTLINLLSGFLTPAAGEITLQGQTATTLHAAAWQKQLTYLPQNPYIFSASLRENIAFYHPTATEAEVQEAVHVVGLDDLVAELPAGLETQIGAGKRALSGGQAQRIALARAFLDPNRRVMIFDEPTAHLDLETELELKEKMLPLMADHLVLFATHRLHWMKQMDYILVMEDGHLVEQGTYQQLQAQAGAFQRLVKQMQAKEEKDAQ